MGKLVKRIAVGMDLSAMDETVIRFAEFVARRNKSIEVYFIHVVKYHKFPEELKGEFPDIEDKVFEDKEKELREKVERVWDKQTDIKKIFLVKKGKIAKNLLNILDANDIDLVIIGKSTSSKERGLLAQKVARLANSQLLIVPEGCEPKFVKLLVPINHSDNDKIAIEKAVDIARLTGSEAEIICQNIFSVPTGYHYTGKSYDEFVEVMKKNTEKKYKALISQIDISGVKIRPVFSLDKNDDSIAEVYELALREKPDTILLGAKGLSSTTALFLSSIAEKLIQVDTKFPIRIVRVKGDNARLIDFIRKI